MEIQDMTWRVYSNFGLNITGTTIPAEAEKHLALNSLLQFASLARCLPVTILTPIDFSTDEPGRLVLAWCHIGSLAEMALHSFLAVYQLDYLQSSNKPQCRDGSEVPFHKLSLENLIVYFSKNVWSEDQNARWNPWLRRVQNLRNAIHYGNREIQNWAHVEQGVIDLNYFICDICLQLPDLS